MPNLCRSFPIVIFTLILLGCQGLNVSPTDESPTLDRENHIPAEQVKVQPVDDIYPPRSLTLEYTQPQPLPYPLNTAGAEDSAFILPDGVTLYLWFTPDVNAPIEEQLQDGVTGIYQTQKVDSGWREPRRILLQDAGKLALDGCAFVVENQMYFCSAREGYTGLHWFSAQQIDGVWTGWSLVDFPESYQVGELHITADGRELYFHADRPGGLGGYDLWKSDLKDGAWGEPVNLTTLNSPQTDGWPFVTPDGDELWYTRGNGSPELWRAKRVEGIWTSPQRMFAPFAGEASLDSDGNVFFTHHFYKDNLMLEADIYWAEKVGD